VFSVWVFLSCVFFFFLIFGFIYSLFYILLLQFE